jgi:hypothetical protein
VFHRNRILLAVALLCTATAGYAALRWTTWMPADACLLCAKAPADATSAGAGAIDNPVGSRGSLGTVAGNSAGAFTPGPLGASGSASATDGANGGSSRFGSAPRGWQPWGVGTGTFRVSSSEGSGSSAALGGLWRLVSLSRPGGGGPSVASNTAGTSHTNTAAPATTPAPAHHTPKPPASSAPSSGTHTSAPATPSAGNGPPASANASIVSGPISSGGTSAGGSTGGSSAPTDPFHSHEDPPPPPFGGGGGSTGGGGGFDPGGSGGVPVSGGGVSATPEPGAVLLLGSGLLAILGVLRRRRLI